MLQLSQPCHKKPVTLHFTTRKSVPSHYNRESPPNLGEHSTASREEQLPQLKRSLPQLERWLKMTTRDKADPQQIKRRNQSGANAASR